MQYNKPKLRVKITFCCELLTDGLQAFECNIVVKFRT